MNLSTLELSSGKLSELFYRFENLKYCYAKSIGLIFWKLTACNKDTIINLNIYVLRNQITFNDVIKSLNVGKIVP